MKKYNFFKIDVHGRHGYTFLVATKFNESEDSIIDIARDCGAFEDADDAEVATAERVEKDDHDYKHLEDTLIYLDAE